jgi:tetratricopeptide (TPR) repeat protein
MWSALEQAGGRLPGGHAGQALPAPGAQADDSSRVTVAPPASPHKRATAPARVRARLPVSLWAVAAVALGLALGGWFFYYNSLAPARLEADLRTAQAQLAAGDYPAALDSFDSVLARDPDGVEALLGRADALLGLGQPDVALETIESAVELAPAAPEVYVTRGRYRLLYTSGPDVDASLRDFDTALGLQPDYAPAYLARGWAILNFQHDPTGALPDLRQAAQLAADDPEAHRTLAAALSQAGDPAQGLEEMHVALSLKSDDPDYFIENAVMNHAVGYPAVPDLDAAIALRPDSAPYYAMRAYLNSERYDYDAALADAEHALRLQPGNPDARGLTYYRLSNFSEALADLDAVLAHGAFEYEEPFLSVEGLREINLDRALVLQEMPGREAEALAAFDASAAAQPDWFAVYYYRGVFLAEQRKTAAARADLELAVQLAPDPEWRTLAQVALETLGD